MTKNLPLYSYSATICTSIFVSIYTAHDVVTFWLIFAKYLSLYYTFSHSHTHTEANTHRHTFIISKQDEWRQLGTGTWLREAREILLLETMGLHTHKKEKNKKLSGKLDIHESKIKDSST